VGIRMDKLNKRKWHYIMKPHCYLIHCDVCEGTNIEWSEYEHKIWCYDCEIDTDGTAGIFCGPIGWGVAQSMGISFNRWNMDKQRIECARIAGGKVEYFAEP